MPDNEPDDFAGDIDTLGLELYRQEREEQGGLRLEVEIDPTIGTLIGLGSIDMGSDEPQVPRHIALAAALQMLQERNEKPVFKKLLFLSEPGDEQQLLIFWRAEDEDVPTLDTPTLQDALSDIVGLVEELESQVQE